MNYMRALVTITLLLLFSLSFSQQKRTVNFLEFKEIKVYDGLWVNLIPATYNKAEISGEYIDDVQLINKNGQLKIRMNTKRFFKGYNTKVDLYFSASPAILDANEEAKISSEETLQTDILELKAQEGGQIEIEVKVDQLLSKAVTGGTIKVKGNGKNQDINLNTGGTYTGQNFVTSFTTIQVNAGGNASINATSYVKATVKAGGTIEIYGNPQKVEEKKILGGKIILKKS